jgi:hypothetical protein
LPFLIRMHRPQSSAPAHLHCPAILQPGPHPGPDPCHSQGWPHLPCQAHLLFEPVGLLADVPNSRNHDVAPFRRSEIPIAAVQELVFMLHMISCQNFTKCHGWLNNLSSKHQKPCDLGLCKNEIEAQTAAFQSWALSQTPKTPLPTRTCRLEATARTSLPPSSRRRAPP